MRPNGTANIADANKNDVGIQLNKIASVENSLPIAGRAILMAELIKGVINDEIIAIIKAGVLTLLLFSTECTIKMINSRMYLLFVNKYLLI